MFSHVMLGANDIEESKAFYDANLSVLKAVIYLETNIYICLRSKTRKIIFKPRWPHKIYIFCK